MQGSVDSIETLGLVDGPGIRTVVFTTGCKLRCKYCHNPEMWVRGKNNYTASELAEKLIRNKPYFERNSGGVTFSGGEPLLQSEFVTEVVKILKENDIHVALDTAGCGNGHYEEILKYIDLIIFDVKHTDREGYKSLTGMDMDESLKFLSVANKMNKKFWVRQVVVPGIMDNKEYIDSLAEFIKQINNVEKVEFLPYHKLGSEKYETLKIDYPYKDLNEMDKEKCNELYKYFLTIYKK